MTNSPQIHTDLRGRGRRTPVGIAVLTVTAAAGLAVAAMVLALVLDTGGPRQPVEGSSLPVDASGPVRQATTGELTSHGIPAAPKPATKAASATGGSDKGEGGQGSQGVAVFDSKAPSVANLDPDLLAALKRAALEARDDGVELDVNSGWRSAAYQQQLLDDAIGKYGSAKEAARWVATPQTSLHVSGDAVDIGPTKAATWLARHGADFGLCRVYRNEPWHFELRPDAVKGECPAMYADPTQDPRLQQ
jgi:hypothetical protein